MLFAPDETSMSDSLIPSVNCSEFEFHIAMGCKRTWPVATGRPHDGCGAVRPPRILFYGLKCESELRCILQNPEFWHRIMMGCGAHHDGVRCGAHHDGCGAVRITMGCGAVRIMMGAVRCAS